MGKHTLGKLSAALIQKKTGLAKETKLDRHKLWAEKIMCHRGKYTDLFTCAYGNTHRVGTNIQKVGNLYSFKSVGCSGCPIGVYLVGKPPYDKQKLVHPDRSQCFILNEVWLLTDKPVKPGDIISLPKPLPERNVKARMRNAIKSLSAGDLPV